MSYLDFHTHVLRWYMHAHGKWMFFGKFLSPKMTKMGIFSEVGMNEALAYPLNVIQYG